MPFVLSTLSHEHLDILPLCLIKWLPNSIKFVRGFLEVKVLQGTHPPTGGYKHGLPSYNPISHGFEETLILGQILSFLKYNILY